MKDELFVPVNKKADGGNGNSVIDNHEGNRNKAKDHMSENSKNRTLEAKEQSY